MQFIALLLLLPVFLFTQDSLRSSVYKKKGLRYTGIRIVQPSDVTYRLWEGFTLVRKANAGDAAALHELGIRYLTGEGFPADTVKAFQLIKSAAEKKYLLAHFNLGVFYHNGWGTNWNPFEAYKNFKYAAENDLKEGEYAYGLYFTDDLAVQRNWKVAYQWVKKSADQNYEPAKEVVGELARLAAKQESDSSSSEKRDSTASNSTLFEPVLLDFAMNDSQQKEESDRAIDIVKALGQYWQDKIKKLSVVNDTILFSLLNDHAQWGVPEEFTVLGRFYEKGIGVEQDSLKAVLEYLRATRLESRRAPSLLLRILSNRHLVDEIQRRSKRGDPESMYAVSCFALSQLYPAQKKEDIIVFLQKASQSRYVPAMIELANAYFSGQLVMQQKEKAEHLWDNALKLGCKEAEVRIASAKIIAGYGTMSTDSAFAIIERGNNEESLLAEVTLGLCYEKGIVVERKLSEAAKYYRRASSRGSKVAYASLRRMYDAIRPVDKEFQITDSLE